jgi:hypothetical protein
VHKVSRQVSTLSKDVWNVIETRFHKTATTDSKVMHSEYGKSIVSPLTKKI